MTFAPPIKTGLADGSRLTPASWIHGIVRRLRVLRYWREHQALSRLELVRRFAAAAGHDLFHHLGPGSYLANDLSPRERVQCVLSHYRFEDAAFGNAYHQAVYGGGAGGGISLWQHQSQGESGEHLFSMRLDMAPHADPEGKLTLSLLADGNCLHRLSYTWVDGQFAGVDLPAVPFVTRNQGRWADSGPAFDAFEEAFPNNSPSFFCFAALQGIAQALGVDRVVAIKCTAHVAYNPLDLKHFENAYDGFWKILGGVEMPGRSYLIQLPFYLKPLADMPSKHRKRAAQRREFWRAIGDSTRTTMLRHMAPAAISQAHNASAPATAEA